MKKQCQSCGMPLKTNKAGDCRGTEADDSKSEKWCSLCFKNGSFTESDCTLDQMRVTVDTALGQQGSGRLMRWMAQKQLPKLERWSGRE
ncbi:zinc ribbon domain-containing protein [Candidatus Saccharibacteria bacterium]|nr:zinc ribbon domain-containing protein [Candidatus Saccharibacteria bacterium]